MSARRILERWRALPSPRVFLQAVPPRRSRDEPPRMIPALSERVRRLSADATIVQRAPADAVITIELARACSGTRRRVHVEWPGDAQSADRSRQTFLEWHRPLVESGLLPFVSVERDVGPLLPLAALVYPDDARGGGA